MKTDIINVRIKFILIHVLNFESSKLYEHLAIFHDFPLVTGWGGDSDDEDGPPKTVGKSGTKNEKTMTYEEITSKIKLPKLWQDPDFPADETSLYLSGKGKKVEWKRPRVGMKLKH